jgi:3-dehydroquinate dehydratase/shikimate dehydrogenase
MSRICAVITEETIEAARAALRRAASIADIAELRLDYLRDFDFNDLNHLALLLKDKPLPIIITCRAYNEGGQRHVEEEARLKLLVEGAKAGAEYCDIEAASFEAASRLSPDPSRLIVSHHNFAETPSDLEEIYERLCALPAAIHKIATRANRIADSLRVLRLIDRARNEGRQLIAVAMGEAGLMTRVIGPSRGSFLTFGSLTHGRESAPGQATCEELRDVYRVRSISRRTAMTGIIGNPVSHSASPAMHNAAFRALGLDFVYLPFQVEDPAEFFSRLIRADTREMDLNFRGLSVTIPHKVAVASLLDEIEEPARKIGAVNTVVIEGARLRGYNTDAEGAMGPLEKICELRGESCAVLGAGGAARAVVYGLRERGAHVTVFARDVEKARSFEESFGARVLPFDSFASSDARIVINTTPVGQRLLGEGQSLVPRRSLAGRSVVYDLVYNPLDTQLLRDARKEGCRTLDGLEMLVSQAALQFQLWTGHTAPTDVMREAAIKKIAPAPIA